MLCFAVAFLVVVAVVAADIELYYSAIFFFNEFHCVGAIRSKSEAKNKKIQQKIEIKIKGIDN